MLRFVRERIAQVPYINRLLKRNFFISSGSMHVSVVTCVFPTDFR